MLGISLLAARFAYLRSIVIAVMISIHPGAMSLRDAPAIADAIATAVTFDSDPVWDAETEAAVMTVYADRESGLRLHPGHWVDPKTGKAVDAHANGFLQIRAAQGLADAGTQSAYWLDLLHDGAQRCSQSPAAPLSGNCYGAGRRIADRRVRMARVALAAMASSQEIASGDGRE